MLRLKRAAILIEDESQGTGLLFEAQDSMDEHPRAHDVDAGDFATLKALATGVGDLDASVLAAWKQAVPGLVRADSVDDELLELRAFAADRRFTLEFFSATEAIALDLDTAAYHQEVIDDADVQFDDVETTLAHLFALPAPALQGRTFGGAFCDSIISTWASAGATTLRVVELGCGTGRFAHDFLARLQQTRPELYAAVAYTLVDLSPALQRSQRVRCAPHGGRCEFVLHDLLTFAPAQGYDVVISNEVIADLPARACYRDEVNVDEGAAAACVKRHNLSLEGVPHAVLINTGAVALVERLQQLLTPGGVAVVTEYGSLSRAPIRVVLGAHVEHSIHFGHLQSAATQVGLNAQCLRVVDWLGMNEAAEVIELLNLDVLRRAVGPFLGLAALPRMAFSHAQIESWLGKNLCRVHGLRFVSVGLHPMRADLFWALVAHRV